MNFNPQADRLRVVSKAGQNLRLNPDTGAAAGNEADGPLAYATQPPADANAGKQPGVTGAAYTNNVARTTSTVLYDVDTTQDVLAIQNPPNNRDPAHRGRPGSGLRRRHRLRHRLRGLPSDPGAAPALRPPGGQAGDVRPGPGREPGGGR